MPNPKKENKKKDPDKKKDPVGWSHFPPDLKNSTDRLIVLGVKRSEIMRQMQLSYPDVEFPSADSWANYCKKRVMAIGRDEKLKATLESLTREVNLLKVDTSNPEAVLHSVIEQAVQRIEDLKRLNAQTHDVGRENVILGQMKVLNDAIKTKMAMENQGYFINERLRESAKVLSNELYRAFIKAYKDIHGDSKFAEFDKSLQVIMNPMYWETLEAKVTQTLIPERTSG